MDGGEPICARHMPPGSLCRRRETRRPKTKSTRTGSAGTIPHIRGGCARIPLPRTRSASVEASERLASMLNGRVVAIVGTRRASDYGMETARELGRGLAACGLIVVSGLAEGIPTAVHAGALEAHGSTFAHGSTLTVMAGGVERCSPVGCTPLYRRILENGCSISEDRRAQRARNWWQPARARVLALLAELVIVVEAADHPWELACAHVAWSRGRHVAAVPGRVSSSASRGTNALLMRGARLVRGPQDALDVLYGVGVCEASAIAERTGTRAAPCTSARARGPRRGHDDKARDARRPIRRDRPDPRRARAAGNAHPRRRGTLSTTWTSPRGPNIRACALV